MSCSISALFEYRMTYWIKKCKCTEVNVHIIGDMNSYYGDFFYKYNFYIFFHYSLDTCICIMKTFIWSISVLSYRNGKVNTNTRWKKLSHNIFYLKAFSMFDVHVYKPVAFLLHLQYFLLPQYFFLTCLNCYNC